MPLFYPEAFITDYLPEGAIILIDEPQRVEESAKLAFTTHLDRVGSYIHEGTALPEQAELICQPSHILQSLDTPYTAMLFALTRTYGLIKPKCLFRFETRPMAKYIGNTPALAADIEGWKRGGSTVMIYAGAHAKRIGDMLSIHQENNYQGKIEFSQGLPLSRQRTDPNHGFGVKSISYIVKKYKGTMDISAADNIFSLNIMLPVPQSAPLPAV